MENALDSGQTRERASDYQSEYDYWKTCIDLANRGLKRWKQTAQQLSRAYAAKSVFDTDGLLDAKQPYHLFYSNISTLQPAVYAQPPKTVCERRFKDKDPVGRVAADVMQRATQSIVDQEDFTPSIEAVRDDWLIRSRGVSREFYEPVIGAKSDNTGTFEDVLGATVRTEYVHWRDFIHPNCRRWSDVQRRWVAFQVYMTRDELVQRFGDKGEEVGLDSTPDDVNKSDNISDKEPYKQATIYEIWDARKKEVLWLPKASNNLTDFLDVQTDPLGLKGFFPCPRPLFSTLDNDDLYPTADFCFYSNQAEQLNLITWKIECLVKALKVVGARDTSCKELDRILSENCEFELIPVENWPVFAEKGGFQGVIAWMPLAEIVKALDVLYIAHERTKAQAYEISGMSDILRGYSDPRSTATAERIKAEFSTPRLDQRRRAFQNYLRDLIRIKAEIIVEKFTPEHLYLLADVEQMDAQSQQLFPNAVQLLQMDRLRTFRIDIETDSTISNDNAQQRQDRLSALSFISTTIKDVAPFAAQFPALLPLIEESFKTGIRVFPEARGLEGAIDQTFEALRTPKPPEQQGPDPAMLELQQKSQVEQAKLQAQFQLDQAKCN